MYSNNTAEYMRTIATKAQQKERDFPYELYNMIIEDIQKEASKGNFSTKYTFSKKQIENDLASFRNLQHDWQIIRKELFSLGYTFNTTIDFYDNQDFYYLDEFYIEILW